LGYKVDSEIVLAHGLATTSFSLHDNKPFTVVGIWAPTGTPVDQTIHVPLQGIDAMHSDWPQGPSNLAVKSGAEPGATPAKPESITAFMLGLKSKMSIFGVQRQINDLKEEPLMAILPGVALAELWQMVGLFEDVLRLISALVLLAAVLGLGAVLLSSVRERNQEIHLLRILGAPPYYLFFLIEMEAVLITLAGMLIGGASLYVALILVEDALFANFGLYLEADLLTLEGLSILGAVLLSAIVVAAVPSVQIYTTASRYFER
jgi:putative ABC transport system permease protein